MVQNIINLAIKVEALNQSINYLWTVPNAAHMVTLLKADRDNAVIELYRQTGRLYFGNLRWEPEPRPDLT